MRRVAQGIVVGLAFAVFGPGVATARVPARLFSYEPEPEVEPDAVELPVSLTLTLADEEPVHHFMRLSPHAG